MKTAAERAKQFPNQGLRVIKDKLFCERCADYVNFEKKSVVKLHVKSQKHNRTGVKAQTNLPEKVNTQVTVKETWSEMAAVFVSTGIPLHVFQVPRFADWMRKNVKNGEQLPSERTLRRSLSREGVVDLAETERRCSGKDVIIIVDETQDIKNRKTICILVAPAETDTSFRMLNLEFVEKCDAATVVQFIYRSLPLANLQISDVIAFITDNENYMIAAGKILKLTSPRCIHSTCWAHVLHLVAEEIRGTLTVADEFISKIKASLVKAPSRRAKLYEILEGSGKTKKLPPTPVITRWMTWLETGTYHYTHFVEIVKWIKESDADSKAMEKLKSLIENVSLYSELESICLAYPSLSSALLKLEASNISSSDVFSILEIIRGILELSPSFESALRKINLYVDGKHPAIQFWKDLEFLDPRKYGKFGIPKLPPSLKERFKKEPSFEELVFYKSLCESFVAGQDFSPIRFWKNYSREMPSLSNIALTLLAIPPSSAEVERSFSVLSRILTPARSGFTPENLNLHVRLTYNNRSSIAEALNDSGEAETVGTKE